MENPQMPQIDDDDDCGTAQYGGGGFVKDFKLKVADSPQGKTHNIFRIFPPMLAQRTTGKWRFYHQYHFGYYGTNQRDPSGKPVPRTFVCPRKKNYSTKMIERDCAECRRIDEYKAAMDTRKSEAKDHSPEAFRSILEPLVRWLKSHQFKSQNFLIAKDSNGQIGRLKIPARTGAALDAKFKELWEKKQIDATKPSQGVLVDIIRTGNGFAPDEISFVTEQHNVEGLGLVDRIKIAPLTRAEIAQAMASCRDISDPTPSVVLSDDQISMLVACDGQPETVDRIFGLSQTNAASQVPAPAFVPPTPPPLPAPPPAYVPPPAPAPVPVYVARYETAAPPPPAPPAPPAALPPGMTPEMWQAFLNFQASQAKPSTPPVHTPPPPAAAPPAFVPPAPVVTAPPKPAKVEAAPVVEDNAAWLARMMSEEG